MTTSQSARGFYDLDNILCEEELVPTEFLNDAVGLGVLNSSTSGNNVYGTSMCGSKTQQMHMCAYQLTPMHFVRIDLPKMYAQKYTAKLVAGAETVSMSEWSPWYFLLARRYAEMALNGFELGDDLIRKIEDLIPVLKAGLLIRFRKIILSDHSRLDDMSILMRKLCDMEKRLILKKESAVSDYQNWRKSSYCSGSITGGPQKRKR
eukprot:CFRG3813T1